MKNYIGFILLTTVFIFTGCNDNKVSKVENNSKENISNNAKKEPEKTPFVYNGKYTVLDIIKKKDEVKANKNLFLNKSFKVNKDLFPINIGINEYFDLIAISDNSYILKNAKNSSVILFVDNRSILETNKEVEKIEDISKAHSFSLLLEYKTKLLTIPTDRGYKVDIEPIKPTLYYNDNGKLKSIKNGQ